MYAPNLSLGFSSTKLELGLRVTFQHTYTAHAAITGMEGPRNSPDLKQLSSFPKVGCLGNGLSNVLSYSDGFITLPKQPGRKTPLIPPTQSQKKVIVINAARKRALTSSQS
jgi:hypothetical protein